MPLWHPLPHGPRHQGHIHSFLLAFKAAVCQASNLQMPFGHPLPRRPRHQGHIHSFLLAFQAAVCQASNPPNVPLAPHFGTPYLAGQGTKATSIAFYWHSRLPFARLQTLQMSLWHPLPRRIYLSIDRSIYLSIYQSINLSLHTTLQIGGVGGTRALAHSIF